MTYSRQLDFQRGASRVSTGVYGVVNEDANEACNKAENSSAKSIKTRFAPSPTGALHVGALRTALFSYLYAKANQGSFVLRIEDTDTTRSEAVYAEGIIEAMHWLGLQSDAEPLYQSARLDRYRAVAQELIASGHAYRCHCTKARLEALREKQLQDKEKPRYDGHCRALNHQEGDTPFVIRFKTPQTGNITFQDLVYGDITVSNAELDDLVLIRTDTIPTYNFAVVVDDADTAITHVVRGDDHINNTPRQIHLYQALQWKVPAFAHLPMILGQDGKKLSKRHGAVNVLEFREAGYLPEALLNALVRLGWSHQDQEIFSVNEMMQYFDLKQVSRSSACFDYEKLIWLNQHYMKTLPQTYIEGLFEEKLQAAQIEMPSPEKINQLVSVLKERSETIGDMVEKSLCYLQELPVYNEEAVAKHLPPTVKPILTALYTHLEALKTWEKETLHQVIEAVCAELSLGMGKVAQPLRVALTGNTQSPSIDLTMVLIGRERTLERLRTIIARG